MRKPVKTEPDTFVAGESLCAHPRGESIGGLRAHFDVAADFKICVVFAVEEEAQGLLAGVFLPAVQTGLHAGGNNGESPGKTAAANVGFKTAVPEDGTRRIARNHVGKEKGIQPDAMRVVEMALLNKKIGEQDDVGGAHTRMEGNQAPPDSKRFVEPIGSDELTNNVEIRGAVGRNYAVKNSLNVRVDAPAARKCLGAALGVGVNGTANFGKRWLDFVLTQQEISVAPSDCGGGRIGLASLEIGIAGRGEVAFGFVEGAELEPGIWVARIQREGAAKVADGAAGIGFVERVLPIAAEEIPVFWVGRLEAGGGFVTSARAKSRLIGGAGVADTEKGECRRDGKGEDEDGETRRGVREAQKHSKVLCLRRIGDARRKVICRWRR